MLLLAYSQYFVPPKISAQKNFELAMALIFTILVSSWKTWRGDFTPKLSLCQRSFIKTVNTCKQSFYKRIIEFVLGTLYPRINFTSGVGR